MLWSGNKRLRVARMDDFLETELLDQGRVGDDDFQRAAFQLADAAVLRGQRPGGLVPGRLVRLRRSAPARSPAGP